MAGRDIVSKTAKEKHDADKECSLQKELHKTKGTQKSRKSWLGQAGFVIQCVFDLNSTPGEEWTVVMVNFPHPFSSPSYLTERVLRKIMVLLFQKCIN